jgi:hypothetical protein
MADLTTSVSESVAAWSEYFTVLTGRTELNRNQKRAVAEFAILGAINTHQSAASESH